MNNIKMNSKRSSAARAAALALSAFLLSAVGAKAVTTEFIGGTATETVTEGTDIGTAYAGGALLTQEEIAFTEEYWSLPVTIKSNTALATSESGVANALGGAFYAYKSIILEPMGLTISDNIAETTGSGSGRRYALGGALFAHVDLKSDVYGNATIQNNTAIAKNAKEVIARGGAMYAHQEYSQTGNRVTDLHVTGGNFLLSGNKAQALGASVNAQSAGGAIYVRSGLKIEHNLYNNDDDLLLSFENNSVKSTSSTNVSIADGGAVFVEETYLLINGQNLKLSGNCAQSSNEEEFAYARGGAFATNGVYISIDVAHKLVALSNSADAKGYDSTQAAGGAMYVNYGNGRGADIKLKAEEMRFQSNAATAVSQAWDSEATGGALSTYFWGQGGAITLKTGSLDMTLNSVTAQANGGEAASGYPADYSGIAYGGAAAAKNGITIEAENAVSFDRNTVTAESSIGLAKAKGGALYVEDGSIFIKASQVNIDNNSVTAASAQSTYAYGGALHADGSNKYISFDAETVTISGNAAKAQSTGSGAEANAYGGALYTNSGTLALTAQAFDLTGNSVRASSTNGAAAAKGGAVYSPSDLSITNAKSIVMNANSADAQGTNGTAQGGAIWAKGDITLNAAKLTASGNSATSAHRAARCIQKRQSR